MNKVFNSLTVGLLFFASWFVFGLALEIAVFGTAVFIGLTLRKEIAAHIPQSNREQIVFAPIENPVAASLASQITPNMTLHDIELYVKHSTVHEGIHAKVNRIGR